ncbi:hypothetical protein FOL46_002280 [Perkinsus olseni]|uniref:J domain-containing protein n=1 Tax=Perkinsus olseni TaxID=32597 RepID=A0A7J6M8Y7_PEROL|nr:hypothetical protein FOL46_002280 [Perkinsus olseni]
MSPPGSPMSVVMGSPLLEATYSRFRDGDEIMERSISGGKRLRGFFEAEARPAKMVRRLGLEEERAARKRKRTDGDSRGPVLSPMVRRRLGSPMGKRSAAGGDDNESSRKHRRVDLGLMENDGPSRSGDHGKRQGVKSPLMVELERIERLPRSATPMQVLGLPRLPSNVGEVKKKLRALSKVVHPDKTANEKHLRGRAGAAFQRINSAAQEAIKLLEEATTAPPGRVQELTYRMEGEVLVVQWRPPADVNKRTVSSYRVVASAPGTAPIEQGVVNAQGSTTDDGWVECAISSQGRRGNDTLFLRQQFQVTVNATNPSGHGPAALLHVSLNPRPPRMSQTPRRLVVGDGRTGASRQQQQQGMLEPFPAKVYHPPSESEEEREGRQPSSSAESISPISDKTDGVYRRRTTVDNAIHMSVPLHYNSMPWTPERPPNADVKPFPQSKDHWRTPATTASSPSGVALISSASMAYETRMEVMDPRQSRLSPLGVIRPPFPALQRESFRRLPTGESSYSPLGYDTQDESQDYSPANVDPQWIPLGAAVASGHLPPPDDVVESRITNTFRRGDTRIYRSTPLPPSMPRADPGRTRVVRLSSPPTRMVNPPPPLVPPRTPLGHAANTFWSSTPLSTPLPRVLSSSVILGTIILVLDKDPWASVEAALAAAMSSHARRSSGRQTPVPMDISPPPTRRKSARLSPLHHNTSTTLLQIPRLKGLSRCHSQPVIPSVGRLVLKPAKRRRDSVEDRQQQQEPGSASGPRPRKLRRSVVLKTRRNPVKVAASTSGKKRGRKSMGAQDTRTPVGSPAVRRRLLPSTSGKRSRRGSLAPQPTPEVSPKARRRVPPTSSGRKRSLKGSDLPKPSPSASPPSRRRLVPPTAGKRSLKGSGSQQRLSSPRKRRKSGPGPERKPSPPPAGSGARGSTGGSIARMTIKMLKEELTKEGIDFSRCVEKSELVEKLKQARQAGASRRKQASARGSPAAPKAQELRPPRRSLRLSQAAAALSQPKAVLKSPLMVELERIERLPRSATPMQVLGLPRLPSNVGEVKKKLRALSKVVHPDKTANEKHLRGRAGAAFQRINSAAQEAIKLLEEATTAPPGRVRELTYRMEGEVLVVQWRPPTDVNKRTVSSYRVVASAPGTTPIEQGIVNAQGSTTDDGWVECAISSQGRRGNDTLFLRQQFQVTVNATNPSGQGPTALLHVSLNRGPPSRIPPPPLEGLRRGNTGSTATARTHGLGGLRRHNTVF